MALLVFYVFDICFNRFLQKLARETEALGIDSEDSGAWLELKHPHALTLENEQMPVMPQWVKGKCSDNALPYTAHKQCLTARGGKMAGELYLSGRKIQPKMYLNVLKD